MKIYGDSLSGNCYKLKLACSILQIEHEWVHVDILAGETQNEDFRRKNPNGKVPMLELENGECLSESNAILNYLAAGSALLPTDPFQYARVLQWQFFEQYSHEPFIAVARFIARYLGLPEDRKAEYEAKQPGGHKALKVMETQLLESDYLVDNSFSIADIALYAYTHVANEGGFDLNSYPAILAWMERIVAQPGYCAME
ncbi:MAG: glutathione S-transferase family protein [Gammaproteobacteria bacterium]|nr:glutathione S-transferase family protein [Gammaproteobacteria bacterium]